MNSEIVVVIFIAFLATVVATGLAVQILPQDQNQMISVNNSSSRYQNLISPNDELQNTTMTLDTTSASYVYWSISIRKRGWFEYYVNTTDLQNSATDPTFCGHKLPSNVTSLQEVSGIWAACYSKTFECYSGNSHCPRRNISFVSPPSFCHLRSVHIPTVILGNAGMRLTAEDMLGEKTCYEYSRLKNSTSPCEHVPVPEPLELNWLPVEFPLKGEHIRFSIELDALLEEDLVLIDKIEVRGESGCYNGDAALDIKSDTTSSDGSKWEISSMSSRRMEYYDSSNALKEQMNDPSTCANIISESEFDTLTYVYGIWSSCRSNEQLSSSMWNRRNVPSSDSTDPMIYYAAPKNHYVYDIGFSFYLQNRPMLRLHAADECWDMSGENDALSECDFVKIRQDEGIHWRGYTLDISNLKASEFTVELISRSAEDVILLDKIEVTYDQCEEGECAEGTTSGTNSKWTTPSIFLVNLNMLLISVTLIAIICNY